MADKWYSFEKVEIKAGGDISASIVAPPDSPWFSGHFPGDPILPAIAQLAMVIDVAQKAFGGKLIPKAVKRTKYRRIIRPDETVDIALSRIEGEAMTYSFQLTVNGEMASKGSIKTVPAK